MGNSTVSHFYSYAVAWLYYTLVVTTLVVTTVAFSESADGPAGSKKLAMTMSSTVSSSQTAKKTKTAKRKLHSVSGTSSAKVIF